MSMMIKPERTKEMKQAEQEILDEWLRYEFCKYVKYDFTDFSVAEVSDHFGENTYTLILKDGTVYNSEMEDLGDILRNA